MRFIHVLAVFMIPLSIAASSQFSRETDDLTPSTSDSDKYNLLAKRDSPPVQSTDSDSVTARKQTVSKSESEFDQHIADLVARYDDATLQHGVDSVLNDFADACMKDLETWDVPKLRDFLSKSNVVGRFRKDIAAAQTAKRQAEDDQSESEYRALEVQTAAMDEASKVATRDSTVGGVGQGDEL
ncbi:hypothetical protein C8J56DRAFT_883833 [Mycena floridula]|nr:hypothetical protein C8J56DRAFT_883833 [Mycena floridula]